MKLTANCMRQLGFKSSWPLGNPTEPWWHNDQLDITFYGLPTAKQFIDRLRDDAAEQAVKCTRDTIKEALGL